jgi:hypothetical protein
MHIPHYDESGAPHYHLPMLSHKAAGLYKSKPPRALYYNIMVNV